MTCCQFNQFLDALKGALCMPEFPGSLNGGGPVRTYGQNTANTLSTLVESDLTTANTKGAIVELTAATEFEANWLYVNIYATNPGNTFLTDILVGPGGSEQPIAANLMTWFREARNHHFMLPVKVPAGSRISARTQDSVGGGGVFVSVHTISGTHLSGGCGQGPVSYYGLTPGSSSQGVNVDPGGSSHTKSGWVEITAATERAHSWLILDLGQNDTALITTTRWLVDVAVGASGSEFVLISDVLSAAGSNSDVATPPQTHWPVSIPAGTRLSVRAQCNVTTDGDRDLYVALYGV